VLLCCPCPSDKSGVYLLCHSLLKMEQILPSFVALDVDAFGRTKGRSTRAKGRVPALQNRNRVKEKKVKEKKKNKDKDKKRRIRRKKEVPIVMTLSHQITAVSRLAIPMMKICCN